MSRWFDQRTSTFNLLKKFKFHISDEGVLFIFVQLYYIIKELNEKKLQYFKIQK